MNKQAQNQKIYNALIQFNQTAYAFSPKGATDRFRQVAKSRTSLLMNFNLLIIDEFFPEWQLFVPFPLQRHMR